MHEPSNTQVFENSIFQLKVLANQITKTVRDYEMRLACRSSDESNWEVKKT